MSLNRALSKLGILSRAQATDAIRRGQVKVNGRVVLDPACKVVPEQVRIEVDGAARSRERRRTLLFHKPRGVVTTRRDPEGRRTVYDVIGSEAQGLIPVGRLDLATSGLLLLTNDTQLAEAITNPSKAVRRVYLATVRGGVTDGERRQLETGVVSRGERLAAAAVTVRKSSRRESHLTIELREGRNREVRRLCESIGHEVTRLKRVALGGIELGDLKPGDWRELRADELKRLGFRAKGLGQG